MDTDWWVGFSKLLAQVFLHMHIKKYCLICYKKRTIHYKDAASGLR